VLLVERSGAPKGVALMSARTALRRGGGMFAVASMCWFLSGPARALTPDGQAVSSKAARGVTYGGSTSADDPIVIRLSHDGMSVRRISTRLDPACTDGQPFGFFLDGPMNRAITASGRFAATGSDTDDFESGITARKTVSLNAKVKGKKITGSQHAHVDRVDAAGAVLATCEQTDTFTAISAGGKVFGGRTSQGGPVVVELNATRRVVRHFRIGWESSCTSGAMHVGETLIDFPLAGRRFGDDFTSINSMPTGEKETLDYSMQGKIKRARVTGTFHVKATEADAAGATFATCDTGAISYTASSG
jgi:hypothetical protein